MEIKFINPFFISAIDVEMNIFKNFLVTGYYYFLVEESKKNHILIQIGMKKKKNDFSSLYSFFYWKYYLSNF
jgi:hypothetical protein